MMQKQQKQTFSTEQILNEFINTQQGQLNALRVMMANLKDRENVITQLNNQINSLQAELSESSACIVDPGKPEKGEKQDE